MILGVKSLLVKLEDYLKFLILTIGGFPNIYFEIKGEELIRVTIFFCLSRII